MADIADVRDVVEACLLEEPGMRVSGGAGHKWYHYRMRMVMIAHKSLVQK